MASATNLQERPVPSSIPRDRSLQSTSGEYKRRGNSDTVKVPLHERVQQFPDENIVSFIFPNMVKVVCFSHTWKDLTGRAPKSYSETRWWSRWEVYQQLMVQFGDVERYMEEAKDAKVCPQILPELQEILSDPQQHMLLKLELAATMDVGEHFVKATYFVEGDGPLIFSCYEKLSTVNQACQAPHYPNVHAIAREDPGQNVAALERRAKACVELAITWFQRKFNVDLYDLLMAFKAARLFCPVSVQWLRPTDASVESLRAFPFLDSDEIINGPKAKLPDYLAAAEDVNVLNEEQKVQWWHRQEERLPRWATAVKQVLLIKPSSAVAERVFSILKASFNEQQDCALVDYIQASVMAQNNKR